MKTAISYRNIEWWFWALTLVLIIIALAGYSPGYYAVILISFIQVVYFTVKEKSIIAFPTQVRMVYLAYALFGLWAIARFYLYIPLLLGTLMVTFLGRCAIAIVLKRMPWNKHRDMKSCAFEPSVKS